MGIIKTKSIIPFAMWILLSNQLSAKSDSLRFEVLLTNKMLNEIHLNNTFINSLDITSNRLVLLSTPHQFYVVGWGGIKPLGKKDTGNISAYAFTNDRFLLTISNKELCSLDSNGNLSKLFKLPNEGMGISAGRYVMYIYDRNKNQQKHALYVLARGGKYAKLFEVPEPIYSVVEMNNSVLFTTENGLFRYTLKSKELKALAVLPGKKEIKSIALDTSRRRIYFSTDSAVYALKDSSAVMITNKFGGVLRYLNGGLIVFNPQKKLLIRIVGIETSIASLPKVKAPEKQPVKTVSTVPEKAEILTNSSIINLAKENLSDDIIISVIKKSDVNFTLVIDSLIFLSQNKVSSPVIMEMKNAMKRKNDKDNK